jgi:hypothetical protein
MSLYCCRSCARQVGSVLFREKRGVTLTLRAACLTSCMLLAAADDDTPVTIYTGGQSYAIASEPSIILENEVLQVDLYSDHYSVTATLQLHNTGAAKALIIGFPQMEAGERPAGANRVVNSISNFATETDGINQATEEKAANIPVTGRPGNFINKLFTRSVSFDADQQRTIVDRYDSTYEPGLNVLDVHYLLGTASSWTGIGGLRVVVTNHASDLVFNGVPSFSGTIIEVNRGDTAYQTPDAAGRTYEANFAKYQASTRRSFRS